MSKNEQKPKKKPHEHSVEDLGKLCRKNCEPKCIAIFNYCADILNKKAHTEKQRYAQGVAKSVINLLIDDTDLEQVTENKKENENNE